jgi:dihydroorotate dehydrogenase
MGLSFSNPLGLAAGYDRTGEHAAALLSSGFGHVEIGTVNTANGYSEAFSGAHGEATRLGINIGSSLPGLNDIVIDEFVTQLKQAAPLADYVVANLSAPTMQRNGNSQGVERLLQSLSTARDALTSLHGRRTPLLVKLEGGGHGTAIPTAIAAARALGLDGIILVSDCLHRLHAICRAIDPLPVISVGGIRTASDARHRLTAGAALIQIHRAFTEGGTAHLRQILEEI